MSLNYIHPFKRICMFFWKLNPVHVASLISLFDIIIIIIKLKVKLSNFLTHPITIYAYKKKTSVTSEESRQEYIK